MEEIRRRRLHADSSVPHHFNRDFRGIFSVPRLGADGYAGFGLFLYSEVRSLVSSSHPEKLDNWHKRFFIL